MFHQTLNENSFRSGSFYKHAAASLPTQAHSLQSCSSFKFNIEMQFPCDTAHEKREGPNSMVSTAAPTKPPTAHPATPNSGSSEAKYSHETNYTDLQPRSVILKDIRELDKKILDKKMSCERLESDYRVKVSSYLHQIKSLRQEFGLLSKELKSKNEVLDNIEKEILGFQGFNRHHSVDYYGSFSLP